MSTSGSAAGVSSGTNSGSGSGSATGGSTGTAGSSTGTGSGTTAGTAGSSTGTGSGTTAGTAGSSTGTGAAGSTAGAKSGSTAGSTTGTSGSTAGAKSGSTAGSTTGTSGTTAGTSTGTAGTASGTSSEVDGGDPCSDTTLPTDGTVHMSSNAQGMADGLDWTIWSNGSGGSITTYADAEAFSATWTSGSNDFLARLGLSWDSTKTYTQLGTITAEFSETKSSGSSGGGYSYIGIYGWSVNPCIEFYIVDDSFNKMPVNPGSTTNKGTAMIDGGSYTLYTRPTTGTGGNQCGASVQSWTQFYSVRSKARACGTISVSQHFAAWDMAGMTLGNMNQAQILVEVGGGSGTINFPVASMSVQSM
ncbi:MAG TPA: glycoside hydrolase family 11 protein [Polyangiaceae bacterium]|nr:glycoside hydrolase family 11 protein [Polyangiaceae bacterium]